MQAIKFVFKAIAILLIAFLLYFNYSLYRVDSQGIQKQRSYLKRIIHQENAAAAMQSIFPEGFVFMNALYGLTWCDRAMQHPNDLNSEAFAEIDFSLQQLESEEATRIFNPGMPLPNGAFYNGWLNYLRGRRLACDGKKPDDPELVGKFKAGCAAISNAWQNDGGPYLETYPGQTWPADNMLCLASLALHDRLFEPRYQSLISAWVEKIKAHLDPKTGLIPHSFYHAANQAAEGARGSSQSLMLCFLSEIDAQFARQQYQLFKANFLCYRLGLPGISEYPKGQYGMGDVDSGPVVLGIGGAASIVGIRAMGVEDCHVQQAMRAAIEGLLFPSEVDGARKYLFGQLPMLDAFMAWSYGHPKTQVCKSAKNWRWKFQVISICVLLPLAFWLVKGWAQEKNAQP